MKKQSYILILAIVLLFAASCHKRSYTCRCHHALAGTTEDVNIKTENSENADAACENHQRSVTFGFEGPECHIVN